MSDIGKSYRIRTNVGEDSYVNVNLEQDYDTFEILSIKMSQEDTYRLHNANYGVIVGRVLANENFGVPNAKISVFIEGDMNDDQKVSSLYPYQNISSTDSEGRRYNLLPDNKVDDCHQVVGTFPNKTYLLDNDDLIEVFDKYYRYTTRTNNSGDYIICGVPTGTQTLHMDLDLSDCGILSQRPRDFVYKGYTIEQFENANQFKTGTDYESLSQIFTQNQVVEVIPFWGNESEGQSIGITRADIKIAFKFEPTCVFMGSVVGDNASNGVSKKCIPTNNMGAMDELTTGEGTIEMIRKTPDGSIEEFQVKGTQLINSNGVWCYQIPMNLDYLMTDEYGNMVPTDDPSKGIPTRARVRFRISMQDNEQNTDNYFRAKVLVPHNPQNLYSNGKLTGHEDYDYEFGTYTKDESFRDLFWNNVYTVKSYIPRFQKSKSWRNEKFSAIKHCNIYGNNNPMPYNNIRIKLPLMFTILCALINAYIGIVSFVNYIIKLLGDALADLGRPFYEGRIVGIYIKIQPFPFFLNYAKTLKWVSLVDGLCPDLEGWYFSPIAFNNFNYAVAGYDLLQQTYDGLADQNGQVLDRTSVNYTNSETNSGQDEAVCLTVHVDYLISCVEMNLAQEYKVINFDFYNDWVNGVVYMPRWMRFVRAKQTYLFGLIKIRPKIKACMDDSQMFGQTRYYTQQCALSYKKSGKLYTNISNKPGCGGASNNSKVQNCHKNRGKLAYSIFGGNGGVVHEQTTHLDQFVYYFKPCEWNNRSGKNVKTVLFANDIVLLGSLNEFNQYGIPQAFKYLRSSTYVMPTNLAQTNMDDEGYLYSDGRGTICNGETHENNINHLDDGGISNETLKPIDSTFTATQKYYRGELEYGKTEGGDNYDDTIPLTESAGISWNYTGPGQGSASTNPNVSLYYPGGHFLGLSCFNSQTNIKSCVNLQRICEAGANMSQRREEVRSLNNADGITTVQYSYFVPTGLVSQDDINGTNFRSMFATMNYKRLLCENRFDENTGYPIYDFMYLRPGGFDGALAKSVNKASQYNMMIDVVDETNAMAKSGVTKSDSYDPNEKRNTMTRTIEEQSQDYYMFRLGLQTLEDEEQKSKFLYFDSTNGASLPQYENSFYFYFGLKDGSTALDEFNKQFFSQCESSSIIMNTPTINVSTEFDCCNFTMDVDIAVENMQAPVTLTLRTGEGFDQVYGDINEITLTGTNIYTISLSGIPAGKYEIVVTDGGGEQLTKQVDFMPEDFTVDYETYPFEFRVGNNSIKNVINSGKTTDSGYIQINGKSAPSCAEEYGNDYYVVVRDDEYYSIEDNQVGITLDGIRLDAYSEGKFYAWSVDTQLEIGIVGRCKNGNWQYIKISTTTIRGIDSFDLYLGSKMLPYSTKLSSLTGDWWKNIGSDSLDNWAMRHALFRQIDDDTEMFDNQVLALDVNNSVVGTVLFGAAESGKNASTVVHYADDMSYTDIGGELSDSSLISTWPRPKFTKPCYGEMAMDNNGSVVSECICTRTANIRNGGSPNQYVITVSGNNLTNSSKLRKNHGCIVKFDDGTIVYPIWDGNKNFTYYGDQPEDSDNVNIRIYPIFYYPVMYRPFYGKVNFLAWTNGRTASEVGDTASQVDIQYDMDNCRIEAEIFNGITYSGRKFGSSMFLDSGVTLTRGTGQTDLDTNGEDGNAVLKYYKNVLNTNIESPKQISEFSYSVTEGAPNNSTIKENELDKPYEIELAVTEGSVSNNFPTEITYQDNGFSYTMGYNGGSITDTKFYLSRNGISLNDLDGKGNGFEQDGTMFIPLDVMPGDEGRKTFETNNFWCNFWGTGFLQVYWVGLCGYVYGKFNENIKKWSSKNIPGQATMVKLYKGELEEWRRNAFFHDYCTRPTINDRSHVEDVAAHRYVFVLSVYNGEEATEVTENLVQDLYLDNSNYTGYTKANKPTAIELMNTGYQVLNGLGKKENAWVLDRLSAAGVDLVFTYNLNAADDAEICKSILDNLDDANKFVEFTPGMEIGDSQLNGEITEQTFAIAVTSASTSSKGIINAIKVYPKLTALGYEDNYNPVGLVVTPDGFSGITWEGGQFQMTIDSNIEWYTQFIDEDGNYVESPEWISLIINNTEANAITSNGSGVVDVLVHENEDYENERMITLEFCSVIESTNTDTGEMGPTYRFPVTFHQEARPRLQYIEAVSSTIFSNGGGNLSINVISNRLEREGGWTLTINHETGTEGWLKFDNGETTLTGFGNTTVSLLANANESATENKSRVCISDASEGNECIEFMQGGGSVQFSVYPPELTFESSGGTNYISVVSTAEYSVNSTPRWIECEDDGSGSITVICEEYDGDNDRSGTIEISSGDITKEIKVNQKANKG